MLVKLYFHGKDSVELPKGVALVENHGTQSIHVMDGPRKRFYGVVLTVQGDKAVIDEWLKDNNEVYVDFQHDR